MGEKIEGSKTGEGPIERDQARLAELDLNYEKNCERK